MPEQHPRENPEELNEAQEGVMQSVQALAKRIDEYHDADKIRKAIENLEGKKLETLIRRAFPNGADAVLISLRDLAQRKREEKRTLSRFPSLQEAKQYARLAPGVSAVFGTHGGEIRGEQQDRIGCNAQGIMTVVDGNMEKGDQAASILIDYILQQENLDDVQKVATETVPQALGEEGIQGGACFVAAKAKRQEDGFYTLDTLFNGDAQYAIISPDGTITMSHPDNHQVKTNRIESNIMATDCPRFPENGRSTVNNIPPGSLVLLFSDGLESATSRNLIQPDRTLQQAKLTSAINNITQQTKDPQEVYQRLAATCDQDSSDNCSLAVLQLGHSEEQVRAEFPDLDIEMGKGETIDERKEVVPIQSMPYRTIGLEQQHRTFFGRQAEKFLERQEEECDTLFVVREDAPYGIHRFPILVQKENDLVWKEVELTIFPNDDESILQESDKKISFFDMRNALQLGNNDANRESIQKILVRYFQSQNQKHRAQDITDLLTCERQDFLPQMILETLLELYTRKIKVRKDVKKIILQTPSLLQACKDTNWDEDKYRVFSKGSKITLGATQNPMLRFFQKTKKSKTE